MTTCAYANGVLASDSRITKGSTICQREAQKVFDGEKVMVAIAGSYAVCLIIVDWVLSGERSSERPDLSDFKDHDIGVLVVDKKTKECWEYESVDLIPVPSAEPMTLGSGDIPALASMITMQELGCDMNPILAIKIASMVDVFTDDNIQFIDINPKEEIEVPKKVKKKAKKKVKK